MTQLEAIDITTPIKEFDEITEEVKDRLVERLPLLLGTYKGVQKLANHREILSDPSSSEDNGSLAVFDESGRIKYMAFTQASSHEFYTLQYTSENKV